MVKFDEKLCLDQLLKHLAYQRLYLEFSKRTSNFESYKTKGDLLTILDSTYSDLVKSYSGVCGSVEKYKFLNLSCSEYVVFYLKQARDEIAMDICNLNYMYNMDSLKHSLKSLVDTESTLNFENIPM